MSAYVDNLRRAAEGRRYGGDVQVRGSVVCEVFDLLDAAIQRAERAEQDRDTAYEIGVADGQDSMNGRINTGGRTWRLSTLAPQPAGHALAVLEAET